MGRVVHISEAEAARDFAAVMRCVRAGDEIVVEGADGPVALMRSPDRSPVRGGSEVSRSQGKTVEEIMTSLERWEAEHGRLAVDQDFVDEDFEKDMEEAHRWANAPLDESKWD